MLRRCKARYMVTAITYHYPVAAPAPVAKGRRDELGIAVLQHNQQTWTDVLLEWSLVR